MFWYTGTLTAVCILRRFACSSVLCCVFSFFDPCFPVWYAPFLSAVSVTTSATFYARGNAYTLPMFGVYMSADEYDASPGATLEQQAVQLHVHGGAGARRWRAIPRVVVHVRARTSGEKQSTSCIYSFLCKVQHSGPPLMFSTVAIPICFVHVQSTALPLLIRTPNGRHAAGMGRDRYVPNPGAVLPAQVEMFVFLGKLMGHALRLALRAGRSPDLKQ